MAYELTFTPRFQKHSKCLTAQEKKQLKNKLELLAENPSHPSLRTKRIQGATDLFECSVNMDIRIIWYYEGSKMIAIVYYLAGLIESWGRGIEKICQACEEDGSPLPEYTIHPGDIMIQFIAAKERIVRTSLDKVTEGVTEKVTEAEQKLLSLLLEDPAYTYAVLAEKLGVSRKTISSRIKSLKDKGVLQRVGSDTKGHWQIKNGK